MKENKTYKEEARAALKGNWPQAVLATVVLILVAVACEGFYLLWSFKHAAEAPAPGDAQAAMAYAGSSVRPLLLMYVLLIFLLGPLMVGFVNALKKLLFNGDGKVVSNSFKIGYGNYGHHVWGYLLKNIFIFLWTLLLVIPGIIKSLSYAMTNYILVDCPELSANQAINLSKDMMYGRKFDLFYLYLSFIGWFLLSIVTLGIAMLWACPYIQTAQASFYRDVKEDYARRMKAASVQPVPAPVQQPVTPTVSKAENPEDYMPKSE